LIFIEAIIENEFFGVLQRKTFYSVSYRNLITQILIEISLLQVLLKRKCGYLSTLNRTILTLRLIELANVQERRYNVERI